MGVVDVWVFVGWLWVHDGGFLGGKLVQKRWDNMSRPGCVLFDLFLSWL